MNPLTESWIGNMTVLGALDGNFNLVTDILASESLFILKGVVDMGCRASGGMVGTNLMWWTSLSMVEFGQVPLVVI